MILLVSGGEIDGRDMDRIRGQQLNTRVEIAGVKATKNFPQSVHIHTPLTPFYRKNRIFQTAISTLLFDQLMQLILR